MSNFLNPEVIEVVVTFGQWLLGGFIVGTIAICTYDANQTMRKLLSR